MPNWWDGLTKVEIFCLARMLNNSANHVLNVAGGIEWRLMGGWDGYHDYADIARDNRALLSELEYAYEMAN